MYDDFLQCKTTTAHEERDFFEWHQGIQYYGFWAIRIKDKSWNSLFLEGKQHISGLTLGGYHRQPHITIASCGLLAPQHFSQHQFDRQCKALESANLSSFSLSVGELNSFAGSPYIAIVDGDAGINTIRNILRGVAVEDSPSQQYIPHMTLGFYSGAFNSSWVVECLKRFRSGPIADLYVDEISFCRYKTSSIQGAFDVIYNIELAQQSQIRMSSTSF